jgi:hypothetical protein
MFMQLDGEFRILNVVGGRAEWDISFKWLCVLIKGGRIAPPKCASNFQRDLEAQGTGGGEEIQLEADVRIQVEGSTRYTVVGYTLLAHHSKVKKPKRWNILSLTSLKRRIK